MPRTRRTPDGNGADPADPRTWARPAPQLGDLAAALRAVATESAVLLADRLVPFTEGTHTGMFAGPTTTRPAGHLVVFSLRDVPDELRAVATLLALDTVWRQAERHKLPNRVVGHIPAG